MGTIASVLQWTCTNCNIINPTECLKCLKCGNIRKILESDSNNLNGITKCDSFSNNRIKTLPGYVEITSDG